MDFEKILTICGKKPPNYIVEKVDENKIFEVDSNFVPINLYDFWGNAATVNSYAECASYVNGGWSPVKTTIFDFIQFGIVASLAFIVMFTLFKFRGKIKNKIFINFKKIFLLIEQVKTKHLFFGLFPLNVLFIFDFVKVKSASLPSFIDEYLVLTSNVGFFTSLNYNAGSEFGGNYSVQLTSGPLSNLGAVIGWIASNSFYVARISNFLWIYIIQLAFILILKKVYLKNIDFLLITNGLFVFLIPWWIGSLYGIGEIASMIVFTNAMFLFRDMRKFSIFLFAVSIIFGKYLTLLGFIGFYFSKAFKERNILKVSRDFIYFSLPVIGWLKIVNSRYQEGNAFSYINNQINFILGHQSSGFKNTNLTFFDNLVSTISSSEFINWNNYEKFRVLIVPLIFMLLLLKNKEAIDNFFGYYTVPLLGSVLLPYIWFWIVNPTKWIRLNQHFTVVIIISVIYLINFEVIRSKLNIILLVSLVGIFIDNNKSFIAVIILLTVGIILFKKDKINYNLLKLFIICFLLIDIAIPYYEKSSSNNLSPVIEECISSLANTECKNSYINNN